MKTYSMTIFIIFVIFISYSLGKATRETEDGRLCANAFVQDGVTYFDCTTARSPDGLMDNREWCYVESAQPGTKKWDYCKAIMDYNKVRKHNQNEQRMITKEIRKVNKEISLNVQPAQETLTELKTLKIGQEDLLKQISDLNSDLQVIISTVGKLFKTKDSLDMQEKNISDLKFKIDQKIELRKELENKSTKESMPNNLEMSKKIEAKEAILGAKKKKTFNCKGMMYYEDEESGDGLVGRYYNNEMWLGEYFEIKSSQIDFELTGAAPIPELNSINFSSSWSGFLYIPYSGNFQFHVVADDGVELKINKEVILRKNFWNGIDINEELKDIGERSKTNPNRISSAFIALNGGEKVKLDLKYFHSIHDDLSGDSATFLNLFWSSDELLPEIIPKRYLYSSNDFPPLKVTGFSASEAKMSKLFDNTHAFKDSTQYVLQDIPTQFIGATTLKFNTRIIKNEITFFLNTATIVYIAYISHYPNPLTPDFENTGMVMSLLKLDQHYTKVSKKLVAHASSTLKIYKKAFSMGNVVIKLNKNGLNKYGIPLVLFFGFDSKFSAPVTCIGKKVLISNSSSSFFKKCTASSENPGMKCEDGFNGKFRDEEGGMWASKNEGVGAWIKVEFKGLFEISEFKYKNRKNPSERNRSLEIVFSNGRSQTIQLKNSDDIVKVHFDSVRAKSVKIRILDVYGTINNGGAFKFYGVPCQKGNDISTSLASFPVNVPEFKFLRGKLDTSKFQPFFEARAKKPINLNCRDSITNTFKLNREKMSKGSKILVRCPESCLTSDSPIYGGDPHYSKDSGICKSAYHSSRIPSTGGIVVMLIGGPQNNLIGVMKNGIKSEGKTYTHVSLTFEPYVAEDPIILKEGTKVEINDKDEWKPATIRSIINQPDSTFISLFVDGKNSDIRELKYPNSIIAPCNSHIKNTNCKGSLKHATSVDPIKIRFIQSSYPTTGDYIPDYGLIYGDKGRSFGWSRNMSERIITRPSSSKKELESFVEFPPSPLSRFCNRPNPESICEPVVWTILAGKGKYKVTLFVGDIFNDLIVNFSINGKTIVKSEQVGKSSLKKFTGIVDSPDGFLTLSSYCYVNCENAISKLNAIEIEPHDDTQYQEIPVTKEQKVDCGESYIKGRCDTGPDVLHCLFDDKNALPASSCSGNNALVKIPRSYSCGAHIGKYKCVRVEYDTEEDCNRFCPKLCNSTKCLY